MLTIDTPIGKLTIAQKGGMITHVYFEGEEPKSVVPDESHPVLELAATQITEYFEKRRKVFDLPLFLDGHLLETFNTKVWRKMIAEVPFGATITYGELAALCDSPKATRAVGMANNRNPLPLIIPCHRVVGKNGSLTGFRGGLDVKAKLLEFEKVKNSDHI
ncbi:MAG: methylated-DNA--[protein]-cysteine S-methyltransferase [Firmicutes bacterium]|nr:methylated-DNA--[protein]-cysteine S-methyltransferase [Bacillota bacterium]